MDTHHHIAPATPPHRLLGVWAHPDDEAYLSAGLMARTTDAGGHVTCVTATMGEHGFADDDPRSPAQRARLRGAELDRALATVGVHDSRHLGLVDGSCTEAPFGELVATIAAIIDEVQPDTIVTFGPDGITGHDDHITVGHATTLASQQVGLGRLLYATMTDEYLHQFADLHAQLGVFMDTPPPGTPEPELAFAVDLAEPELDRKRRSLAAHASQTAGLALAMGEPIYREWTRRETFRSPVAADFATPCAA